MRFGRIYNEFRSWVRWTDHISIVISRFPVILVRTFDFPESEMSVFTVNLFGFLVYHQIRDW